MVVKVKVMVWLSSRSNYNLLCTYYVPSILLSMKMPYILFHIITPTAGILFLHFSPQTCRKLAQINGFYLSVESVYSYMVPISNPF